MNKIDIIVEEIITCGCGETDKFANNAFRLLFGHDEPPIIKHNPVSFTDERIEQIISALLKSKNSYAYYFKHGDDVFEAWDLLKGVRVR